MALVKAYWTPIIPLYPSGRRVWVFARVGLYWLHVEVYRWSLSVYFGSRSRQRKTARHEPWLAPWQRATPEGKAKVKAAIMALRDRSPGETA